MLMAIDQHLPPACAFAISVLVERDMDPDAVPEEAVEAAQLHIRSCVRCLSSPPYISPPRKKKRPRRPVEPYAGFETYAPTHSEEEAAPLPSPSREVATLPATRVEFNAPMTAEKAPEPPVATPRAAAPTVAPLTPAKTPAPPDVPEVIEGPLTCVQCRKRLKAYAEALDSGQNVEMLFPEVQAHLESCESGC